MSEEYKNDRWKSYQKGQIIHQLLQEKSKKSVQQQQIPHRETTGPLPLSFSQERLWFLDQIIQEKAAYNVPIVLCLNGQLHLSALEQGLKEVLRRHEILRTIFKNYADAPVQSILSMEEIATSQFRHNIQHSPVDLSELLVSQREHTCQQLIMKEARHLFKLDEDLLIRTMLLRLAPQEHILVVTMHHIISDGWSIGILSRELGEAYSAYLAGILPRLPELPVQYADYALWQKQRLQEEADKNSLVYWQEYLAGAPTFLELPTNRPHPTIQTYRGAKYEFLLPSELVEALKNLSYQENATLFMTLFTAFQALLYRYTGQEDILIGTPVANRGYFEIEKLIGFFVNTLILRANLAGKPSFREALARTRQTTLETFAHQDLPFEKIVEILHPERNLGYQPLFQVMFVLQNASWDTDTFSGLQVQVTKMHTQTALFDLTLELRETEAGLASAFEYNTDLFDEATVARIAGHYSTLLKGILADPSKRLSELSLLTETEIQQHARWNATSVAYPELRCVHELFAEQVVHTPDATAVIYGEEHWTYNELNQRANQIARYLRKQGVGPDTCVGICLERSFKMLVCLLGILKAGGAYVPLDPSYPWERLAFILSDTQVPVLLTQQKFAAKLAIGSSHIVLLDTDWAVIEAESTSDLVSLSESRDLAYVIYTSGSTGQPKGVEITHQNISSLLFGANYVRLDASQILLQMAPVSFDAATFEIWGALLHGGCCVLYPGHIPTSSQLSDVVNSNRVTTLWLTASLFNSIIDDAPEIFTDVRQLLIGGEALSPFHVRKALARLPNTQIINGYGPTESTTFACCYPISHLLSVDIRSIPIGNPINNTHVYILDKNLQPVPVGVPGELYIGGPGLARGYLRRPAITAERFIPHPFSKEIGARLYKTGDVVRYRTDGAIDFIGRRDSQVKIRGFRIELGEIDAIIAQHPNTKECVTMLREDVPGEKRLISYLIVHEKFEDAIQSLNRYLKEHLPEYMLPSAILCLPELPLTSNGKVDWRALPAPDRTKEASQETFVPPRNALEKTLAEIWSEVLNVEQVGIYDNFFDLGGHSLMATKVITRICRIYQIPLSVHVLFEALTIASLSLAVLERIIGQMDEEDLEEILSM